MPLVDPSGRSGFWSMQCPMRREGLAHAHERDCTDGHLPGQCCECGQRDKDFVPPPINVNQRLGIEPPKQIPHPEEEPLEMMSDADAIVFLAQGLGPRTARRRINNLRLLRWLYQHRWEDVS